MSSGKENYQKTPDKLADEPDSLAEQWANMTPDAADFESDVEDLTPTPPEIAATYSPSREKLNQLKFFIDFTTRGEHSMLALSKDGRAEIISDYHDVMPDYGFDDEKCLQDNPELHHALTELADDVATVDATRGDVLNDPDRGSVFYTNLRNILEYRDTNATEDERAAIDTFLEALDEMGNAFSVLLLRMEQDAPIGQTAEAANNTAETDDTAPEEEPAMPDILDNTAPGPYGIEPTYENPDAYKDLKFVPEVQTRGQQSVLIVGTNTTGHRSCVLSSEYFDHNVSGAGLDQEPAIKDNFSLRLALDSLTTDLALIDASRGRNLNEHPERFTENYLKIQRWLADPDTPASARDAINAHFDQLRSMGPSFSVIEQLAEGADIEEEKTDEDKEAAERAERRKTVEANLEQLEYEFKQLQKQLDGAEDELANYYRHLEYAKEGNDPDEISHYNNRIGDILETIDLIIGHLRDHNEEKIGYFMRNNELFDDAEQSQARREYYSRLDDINGQHKRQYARHEDYDQVKLYVRRLNDRFDAIRSGSRW